MERRERPVQLPVFSTLSMNLICVVRTDHEFTVPVTDNLYYFCLQARYGLEDLMQFVHVHIGAFGKSSLYLLAN